MPNAADRLEQPTRFKCESERKTLNGGRPHTYKSARKGRRWRMNSLLHVEPTDSPRIFTNVKLETWTSSLRIQLILRLVSR
eukprot:1196386-Prorocentrum_minimum.AAC.8